MITDREVSW